MLEAPETWISDAKCARETPELYFGYREGRPPNQRMARVLCAGCPVTAECLDFALRTDSRFGVWGGLSEGKRSRLHSAYNREHYGNRRPGTEVLRDG